MFKNPTTQDATPSGQKKNPQRFTFNNRRPAPQSTPESFMLSSRDSGTVDGTSPSLGLGCPVGSGAASIGQAPDAPARAAFVVAGIDRQRRHTVRHISAARLWEEVARLEEEAEDGGDEERRPRDGKLELSLVGMTQQSQQEGLVWRVGNLALSL
jgi:hypothetical protein